MVPRRVRFGERCEHRIDLWGIAAPGVDAPQSEVDAVLAVSRPWIRNPSTGQDKVRELRHWAATELPPVSNGDPQRPDRRDEVSELSLAGSMSKTRPCRLHRTHLIQQRLRKCGIALDPRIEPVEPGVAPFAQAASTSNAARCVGRAVRPDPDLDITAHRRKQHHQPLDRKSFQLVVLQRRPSAD